jgi:hypothetical protein
VSDSKPGPCHRLARLQAKKENGERSLPSTVFTTIKEKRNSTMTMTMWKKMTTPLALAAILVVVPALLAWSTTNAVAQTTASKATAMTGHPEKQHSGVTVPGVTKPMPAPKKEAKASHKANNWVPGDYYWDGNDWAYANGYSLDSPWEDAYWVPGHWTQRWWGWSWVPGYWE